MPLPLTPTNINEYKNILDRYTNLQHDEDIEVLAAAFLTYNTAQAAWRVGKIICLCELIKSIKFSRESIPADFDALIEISQKSRQVVLAEYQHYCCSNYAQIPKEIVIMSFAEACEYARALFTEIDVQIFDTLIAQFHADIREFPENEN